MRTTLDLPTALLYRAQRVSRSRTKTETIIRGLQALLRQGRLEGLLELKGNIPLNVDLERSRERFTKK